MKKSEMLVLLVACLMFAIGMPSKTSTEEVAVSQMQRQEQQAEEADESYGVEMESDDSYQIIYKSQSASENKIADIIWLKKAARVALDAGVPYFNVIKQKTHREFDSKKRRSLSVIEGKIQLDNDPMQSEYDAHAIMNLVLNE